jgi:adenylate cyclase
VRITAQLIDAESGSHLWADRFDGSLEGVFELQEQVAISVAGIIEPTLQAAETARSTGRPTADLTAYDLYLRAYAMYFLSGNYLSEALRLLERAVARDPHYGPALAWGAACCMRLIGEGSSKDPVGDRGKGIEFARRALKVAGDDPGTIANAALALAATGEDIGTMTAVVDRALALNPSFARGYYISGMLRLWAGEPNEAIERAEVARRLSPRARIGNVCSLIGAAHFVSGRFDQAASELRLAIQDAPDTPYAHRLLAACYAHMGHLVEAREVISRLRAITPLVVPTVNQWRKPEHRELLLSGLQLAISDNE